MAWSWSHSPEAYVHAEANLRSLPPEDLATIFAEWRAAQSKGGVIRDTEDFDQRKYRRALAWASRQDPAFLADWIWERASEFATCDNGGFLAWMCPSGCHCVSFDSEESEDEN
jgi:hypothetical protein